MISVLSVGLVAGPTSPIRRERRDDSISCGAKWRFSFFGCVTGTCKTGFVHSWGVGDGVRGDGEGVGSKVGPVVFAVLLGRRNCSKVVSMGTGTKRRRAGCVGVVIVKEAERDRVG